MGEIGAQKSFDMRLAQLITTRDALCQHVVVELATLGQKMTASVARVAFGLEVSGEAVEIRTEQAAAEIDQRAFFFKPKFEHKGLCFCG
jgi:hypothetical protein